MVEENIKEKRLSNTMTMMYWRDDKFWLGKLLEHPEIMTQGLTLEELELNLRDAYLMIAMDGVPENSGAKETAT